MKTMKQAMLEVCDRLDKCDAHGRNLSAKNKALAEIRKGVQVSKQLETAHSKRMDFQKLLRE